MLLVVTNLLSVSGCGQESRSLQLRAAEPQGMTKSAPDVGQQSSFEAKVEALMSEDEMRRETNENELLKLAQQSASDRQRVINQLLTSVRQKSALDGSHSVLSPVIFEYWKAVTSLFWKLKATESVDVMIACVQCSNGLSGTEGDPPAAFALIRMGDLTVPQLTQALLREPDGFKRMQIVICLSRIGGSQAKSGLKKALHTEKDKTVREYIRRALSER
jgi:hypothetical protein